MLPAQLTATLLTGAAIQAAAIDVPASAVAPPDSQQGNANALSTPTNDGRPRARLLQKFKKRREQQRLLKEREGAADLGILSSETSGVPRFLQDNDYDYYCPRDTCPDELCDCADSGGSLEDCTKELQSVCRAGKLSDCVFSDYVEVYQDVYCPFVSCVGEGFRENQCDCAFYELYCQRLDGEPCKSVIQASDGQDKKPFFGCDETELASICGEAASCKKRGDLQGLPELGTWRGSVTTGLPNSGERIGGVGVGFMVGAALLSALWVVA